jgi:type II secretory pathway predicted ATPase ExeA
VIAKSHLQGINRESMQQYLRHHLTVAGLKNNLFDDTAVSAIHQGSGGLLRKANHLARGALIAAAKLKTTTVTAEHVRLASTELFDVNRRYNESNR